MLASSKCNLGPPPPALGYRLVGTRRDRPEWSGWGESTHTADRLVSTPDTPEDRDALTDAADWLASMLADSPRAEAELIKAAAPGRCATGGERGDRAGPARW